MAEAVGKATGRPGVCFVTRGPGATNAAHGVHIARQSSSPMILFVGQVDRAVAGPRRLAGARLRRGVRLDDQVGGRDRRRGADARAGLARLPRRDQRPARPGGAGAAGRHADRATTRPTRRRSSRWRRRPARRKWRSSSSCSARRARRSCCWAAAAGTRRRARRSTRFAERFELPVATGFRRLPLFDPLHPNYAGDLGLGAQSEAAGARQGGGPGAGDRRAARAKSPPRATRCSTSRAPQPGWCTSSPSPRSSAASGARTWRSTPRRPASPPRWTALSPPASPPGAARRRGARRVPRLVGGADAAAGRGEPRRDHDLAARAPAGGRHPHQRRRQLRRLGQPLLPRAPLRRPPRAELRLDGLWRAGGGGDAAALSRTGAWSRSAATATS